MFFMFSGYLFFANIEQLNWTNYSEKLMRRVNSLLTPYIIWNCLAILRFALTQFLVPETSNTGLTLTDLTIADFVGLFWNGYGGNPICYQFWFIRDLIVMCILSPLFEILLRKTGIITVIATGLLWMSPITMPDGLSTDAIFFFCLGAYISKRNIRFTAIYKDTFVIVGLFAIGTLIQIAQICETVQISDQLANIVVQRLTLLCGCIIIINIADKCLQFKNIQGGGFLLDVYFFVYGAHTFILAPIKEILIRLIPLSSSINAILIYIFAPMVTVLLCMIVFCFLKKLIPSVLNILTGKRHQPQISSSKKISECH